MRFLTLILFGMLIISLACDGALFLELNAKDPKNPKRCYSSMHKMSMKFNKDYPLPDTCGKMSCDSKYTITYMTCGLVGINPPCELTEDLSLSYPDCCPQPKCVQ